MRKTGDRSWLDIAEYASLAGSVAGSIAAVASQQVVYAAAPLTLAMSLSLTNRQRLQQQSQQQTDAIADMCLEVRSVHDKIQVLPPKERVNDLEASIRKLEQTIIDIDSRRKLDALVQAFNNRPELKEIGRLNEALSQRLNRLEQLPPPTEPFDPAPLKLQIEKIERSIANLQESVAAAVASVRQELSGEIESQHALVQSCLERLETIDLNFVHGAIAQLQTDLQVMEHDTKLLSTSLQTQVDCLCQQMQNLPSPFNSSLLEQQLPAVELFNSASMQLQSSAVSSESAIAQNIKHLTELAQQFDTQPEPHLLEELTEANANVKSLEELPPRSNPTDPSPVWKEIEALLDIS